MSSLVSDLLSRQTRVLTQAPPFPGVFVVASLRTWFTYDLAAARQVAVLGSVIANSTGRAAVDSSTNACLITDGGVADNLFSVDLTQPVKPRLLDTINLGVGPAGLKAIVVVPGLAFPFIDGGSEFYIVDSSQPDALVALSSWDVSVGFAVSQKPSIVAGAYKAGRLYILNYDANNSPPVEPSYIGIYDVSAPLAVQQVSTLNLGVPAVDVSLNFGRVGSLALFGSRLLAMFAGNIFEIAVGLGPPVLVGSPTFVSSTAIMMGTNTDGSRGYVLDNAGGVLGPPVLRLYDLTQQPAVELDSHSPAVLFLNDVFVRGGQVFVTADGSPLTATRLLIYENVGDKLSQKFLSAPIATGGGAGIAGFPL